MEYKLCEVWTLATVPGIKQVLNIQKMSDGMNMLLWPHLLEIPPIGHWPLNNHDDDDEEEDSLKKLQHIQKSI